MICLCASRLPAPIIEDFDPSALPAHVVFAPKPDYPKKARQKHLAGSGVFILHVDPKTGTVTSVDIEKSIGHKMLDDAAIQGLSRWRFEPGTLTKFRVPIQYTMDEAK